MTTALQVQVDNPRPLAAIIADLSKQIAPEDLESRKQGSSMLVYISWHRALKYLDRYAPGWSYEVRNIYHLAGRVALVVRISIPCAEGVVYREATGQEEEEKSGYGDPTSNAESMALRRAAAKFGLGLYLYDKGKKAAPRPSSTTQPERPMRMEGAQPKSTQASNATGHILAKIKTLGWDNAKVRAWMEEKFNYAIETDDLAAVFDSFGIAEQRKIFGALIEAGGK